MVSLLVLRALSFASGSGMLKNPPVPAFSLQGGASRVLINLVLFILFFSLLLFIYTTVKEGLPNL